MSLMKSLLTGACLTMLPLTALADPALIFDLGGKFDKSFNEAAYVGAERWKAETGGSYKELEMQSEAQREQALRRLAETGANPIVMTGFAFGEVHHVTVQDTLQVDEMKQYLHNLGHTQIRIESIRPVIEDCYMVLAQKQTS